MFSVTQETENAKNMWPSVTNVQTFGENGRIGRVTVLTNEGGVSGLMDFHASRNKHVIYVMNEAGATVGRYDIGCNPDAPDPMAGALEQAA